MIESLLDSIIAAEQKSDLDIKNAESLAKTLKEKSMQELKLANDNFLNELNTVSNDAIKQAERDAKADYDAAIKEARDKASNIARQANTNMQKAVDLILESI